MKIRVYVVDLELSQRARHAIRLGAVFLLVLGVVGVAYAQTLTIFKPTDLLSAGTMNANFAAVATASYCGATQATGTTLDTKNGYAAAATLCAAVSGCGSDAGTGSHMCTSAEMIRHMANGGANTPTGWIATGGSAYYSATSASTDCVGFTGSNASVYGTTWVGNYPQSAGCSNTSIPILCCK